MTLEQWQQFAADMKQAQDLLLSLHQRLCDSVGLTAANRLRKAVRMLQTARLNVDGIARHQAGEEAPPFHGVGWVYMA